MTPHEELHLIRWVCGFGVRPKITEDVIRWLTTFPIFLDKRADFLYDRCLEDGSLMKVIEEVDDDPDLACALMEFYSRLASMDAFIAAIPGMDTRAAEEEPPQEEAPVEDPIVRAMRDMGYEANANTPPDEMYRYLKERLGGQLRGTGDGET